MMVKRTLGIRNPTQRSLQRWENEGGHIKGVREKRAIDPTHRKTQRRKAAGLAGKIIDDRGDRSATAKERQSRKHRLLKGPKEFREMRRDQRNRKT